MAWHRMAWHRELPRTLTVGTGSIRFMKEISLEGNRNVVHFRSFLPPATTSETEGKMRVPVKNIIIVVYARILRD